MNRIPKANVWWLGWVSFAADVASQMVYPLLPAFISSLGAGPAFIGIIEGLAESTAAILKTVSGKLSDRLQKRKVFIWFGYGLSGLVKPLLFFCSNVFQVLFIRFFDRVGKAARGPARDALLAETIAPNRKGTAFGIHRGMDRLGAFIGPLIAWIILWFYPDQLVLVFLFAGIPGFVSLLPIFKVRENKAPITEEKTFTKLLSQSAAFRYFLTGNILFSLGNSSNAFLILQAESCGIITAALPLFWMLYNLICSLSAPLFGHWSDKIGRKSLILIAFFYYALLYFLFGLAAQAWHMWLLIAAYGIHYGMTAGVIKAHLADLIPDSHQRATAFGVFQTGIGLSLLPASLMMGFLWQQWSAAYGFFLGSILALVGAIVVWFSFRYK